MMMHMATKGIGTYEVNVKEVAGRFIMTAQFD